MRLVTAEPGLRGIDTIRQLTLDDCKALKASGVDYTGRYLRSVTPAEIQAHFAAGLLMTFFSYSRAPGWIPDAAMGSADAQGAVAAANALSLPHGLTLWCDFEEPGGTIQQRIDYLATEGGGVTVGQFMPGLYAGANTGLTSSELQAAPHVRYCHACSRLVDRTGVAQEPKRGWSMIQLYPPDVQRVGIEVDLEFTQTDYFGGAVVMLGA